MNYACSFFLNNFCIPVIVQLFKMGSCFTAHLDANINFRVKMGRCSYPDGTELSEDHRNWLRSPVFLSKALTLYISASMENYIGCADNHPNWYRAPSLVTCWVNCGRWLQKTNCKIVPTKRPRLYLMPYLFNGEIAIKFVNQLFQDLLEWFV